MAADTGQDLVKGEPELCLEHEEDANHINIKVPLRPPFLEQDWLGCERDRPGWGAVDLQSTEKGAHQCCVQPAPLLLRALET